MLDIIQGTRARTAKQTKASNSLHWTGPFTHLKNILIVNRGVYGWIFKNREIDRVFAISPQQESIPPNGQCYWIQYIK